MPGFGKILIVVGLVIVGIGAVLTFGGKIPFLGKLPGDINIKRENFQFFFPFTTGMIISVILSLIFWLISFFNKK